MAGPAACEQAIEALSPPGVREVVASIETYDPLDSPSARAERYERFRRHAVATRIAADRIGELARLPERDELAVAALLHDVGRLVLARDVRASSSSSTTGGMAPEARVRCERRELGIDHALVGAVLVRRWGLPRASRRQSSAITRRGPSGHAAAIRLADLIVHHAQRRGRSRRRDRRCGLEARAGARATGGAPLRVSACGHRAPTRLGPLPAVGPRDRRAARTRGGQGLQADCLRAVAFGEHDPHPPAQRLPQDRRGRSCPSGPDRTRPRLDLAARRNLASATLSRCRARPDPAGHRPTGLSLAEPAAGYSISELRRAIATAWARSRAPSRARIAFVWVRTVSALRPRRLATRAVDWPSA